MEYVVVQAHASHLPKCRLGVSGGWKLDEAVTHGDQPAS